MNRKVHVALKVGLTPIVCVGETLEQYESGQTSEVVRRQINAGLAGIDSAIASRLVIAYEPVWAIGTGKASSGENAQGVHGKVIRPALSGLFGESNAQAIRILYDYEPRDYVIERAEPWPDTAGRCSLRSFQLGVVVRAGPAAGRIEATFAGGVGLNGAEADIESVGYTQFRLGGHGVLFESQDRVAVSTGGSGTFARPYLAGDVGIRAGRRAWLFAGVRAQLGTAPALKARPARVVDPEGSLWEPDSAELEQVLTMAPLRLAMPHWQVVAGLRVAIR